MRSLIKGFRHNLAYNLIYFAFVNSVFIFIWNIVFLILEQPEWMICLDRILDFNLFEIFKRNFVVAGGMSAEIASNKTYSPGTHSVAYVTAPSEEVAKNIARGLVSKKLAACVNLIPKVTSIYEWKGEINEDSEVLMMIKTRTSKVDELTEYVRSNHPYEVCEVISLPIENGNEPYLKWIGEIVP